MELVGDVLEAIESIKKDWPLDVTREEAFVDSLHRVGLRPSPRLVQDVMPILPGWLATLQASGQEEGLLYLNLGQALARLASRMAGSDRDHLRREAFNDVTRISNERLRAEAVATLAPLLDEELLVEAVRATRQVIHDINRSCALVGLAPCVRGTQLSGELLSMALELDQLSPRHAALAASAQGLAGESREVVGTVWRNACGGIGVLPFAARRTRKDLLSDLRALNPVMSQLGGSEAMTEILRSTGDVCRWWS